MKLGTTTSSENKDANSHTRRSTAIMLQCVAHIEETLFKEKKVWAANPDA